MRVRISVLLLLLLLLSACQPMDEIAEQQLRESLAALDSEFMSEEAPQQQAQPTTPTPRDPWAMAVASAQTPAAGEMQAACYTCAYGAVQHLDLDGDGSEETLSLYLAEDNAGQFRLESILVNAIDQSWNISPFRPENVYSDGYFIVDLDTDDRTLEIALLDGGADDPTTTFLRYSDGQLRVLGTVGGYFGVPSALQRNRAEDVVLYGNGLLSAAEPFQILQSWRADVFWCVQDDALVLLAQPLYGALEDLRADNLHLTACHALTLYEENAADAQTQTLASGTPLTLLGCDNAAWILVETDTAQRGYLYFSENSIATPQGFLPTAEALQGLLK